MLPLLMVLSGFLVVRRPHPNFARRVDKEKKAVFQTRRIFLTLPRLVWHRGAPISDPARFGVLLNTCRVGDRRSRGRYALFRPGLTGRSTTLVTKFPLLAGKALTPRSRVRLKGLAILPANATRSRARRADARLFHWFHPRKPTPAVPLPRPDG